ncbi:MAG: beta-propeller domain-containing protein, partial [Hyphomonadaceae bacterium]|nr:beta-propeller domain-containing protein [Clostridia bacterium]
DVKDPTAPKILGALKIPGFSDYLHPYDETHLIGFGKDTIEKKMNGNTEPTAFAMGMKLSLFDVTDVANPIEQFNVKIGDRGTDSEALHNHKALLFSKEKNLLAFPVTMSLVTGDKFDTYGYPKYGQFATQGMMVYNLDLQKGFTLKGMVTHLTNEDLLKSGANGGDWNKFVNRALYIGDTMYTLSNSIVKANGIADLAPQGAVELPVNALVNGVRMYK